MLRIAAEEDVSAMLAIYRPYVLTSTATFEYDPPSEEEFLRRYHTITESKNGAGATPIRTDKGWIHIAHGVRNTAAGLRYVLYAFMTALDDPSRVIAEPSGMLLGPMGHERVGDVSNVVFSNGAIADDDGKVYIYYASSDTRLHVAETDIDRLCDYLLHTPKDPLRSPDCVRQRCLLISHNLAFMGKKDD